MFETISKNLIRRGYDVKTFAKAADAAAYITEYAKGKSVGIGGCLTAKQMGLYESLTNAGCEVFWHWITPGRETYEKARLADIYIASANAISEQGEIVNIDGTCNRISSLVFGPKEVIFVIGKNKITASLEDAIRRARNDAAKPNAKRIGIALACGDKECTNCGYEKCICKATLILHEKPGTVKYTAVLIDEVLGY